MDFIEIAIILMLCVLSFVVGQRFNNPKSPPASKNDKYKKLPESYEEDEENAFPLMDTQETMQKNLKGQQKEVDKLLQEIEDLKNKEKKHLVEIEYLKSQLAKQNLPQSSSNKPKNIPEESKHPDLINDAELNNLLNDNKEEIHENQDISNIDKEMEDALNK